jgi:multidrug efflux pump subunit AcrA (membrane-fusion protein)
LVKLSIDLTRSAAKLNRRWRLAVGVAAVIFIFALVPIPNRQFAAGWLQPAETHGVYASSSARLSACLTQDGQSVAVGQPLFELKNDPLSDRLVRYQRAEHVAEIRLEANTRRRDMHNQDVDLNRASHELEEAKAWMTGARRDMAALTLSAPVNGRLIAMPASEALLPQDSPANGNLEDEVHPATTWCDPLQLGRSIGEGSLLACICSESAIAVIPLNESQLATIATGTQVRLRIPESRTVLTQTRVLTVVQIDELASPWQSTASLSGGRTSGMSAAPIRFAAVIELPQGTRGLPGAAVDAVFLSEATTMAHCCLAWLQANLRFFAD